MSDTAHATDDQLAQFAEGKLTGDAFDTVERHLDGCAPCRQLLAAVSNGSTPTMRPERATFSPGDVLGRYRIERLIAAGGMGMLYVALDPQLGRRVALKLMRPSVAAIEGGRVRLLREAQTMASLAHPNVVHVYELGEVEGRVFVAMELVEGGTLRDWMKKPQHVERGGRDLLRCGRRARGSASRRCGAPRLQTRKRLGRPRQPAAGDRLRPRAARAGRRRRAAARRCAADARDADRHHARHAGVHGA